MPELLVTPPADTDASRLGPGVYRKQALPFGLFVHPKRPDQLVNVTPEFAARLKENFDRRIRPIVPVPAKGAGGHTAADPGDPDFDPDDWRFNKGEVLGVEVHPERGLYVTVKVDDEADRAIQEKKLQGVSLSFDPDWFDPQKGATVGPVLRHCALTNIPYVKRDGDQPLEGFERVLQLAEQLSADDELILLSEAPPAPPKPKEAAKMDLEELKKALKKDHNIDLDALSTAAGEAAEAKKRAEAGAKVREALVGAGIQLSEDASADQMVEAVAQLKSRAGEATQLAERVTSLESTLAEERKRIAKEKAERLVASAIKAQVLEPAKKDETIALAETNFDFVKSTLQLAASTRGVDLSEETGTEFPGRDPQDPTTLSEEKAAEEAAAILKRQGRKAA